MNAEDPALNLGKLQKEILLWIDERIGVKSYDELRKKFPPRREYVTTKPQNDLFSTMTTIREKLQAMSENLVTTFRGTNPIQIIETEREEVYLRPEYFESNAKIKRESVCWSARNFLGYSPSNNESARISESLRRLEARGLVVLHKLEGKGVRVSHITLTPKGLAVSLKLKIENGTV